MSKMIEAQLQQLEATIANAQEQLEDSRALDRLHSNRDFQRVMIKGFLNDAAIRLVHLKAAPEMQTPEKQAAVLKEIDAVGIVGQYFHTIHFLARQAESAIDSAEATREEILNGGDLNE